MTGQPSRRRVASILCVVVAVASGSAHALPYRLGLTLSDPNPITGGRFGISVASLGADVLVGSPGDVNSLRHGAVYLFDGTSGALIWTFADPAPPPSVPQGSTDFGASIAVQSDRVLVGAGGAGRAYLFDGTTGALLLTLAPPPGAHWAFGSSVAFAGTSIVVGAPGSGEAFLFDAASGVLLRTFTGGQPSDFGMSVGGVGSNVLAGVSLDFGGGPSCVSTLFDGGTGASIHSFLGSNAVGFGTRVLAGGSCSLDVRLYDGIAGTLLQTFADPNPASLYTFFGAAFAPLGTGVLVGAPIAFGNGEGAVYLFDAATAVLLDTIRNPNPDCCGPQQDAFGISVTGVGANVVVGAVNEGSPPLGPGRAYVFLPSCGDGVLDPGEQCDDGNGADGDCCSASCRPTCTDRPIDAVRLVLRRTAGREKLVFVSRDPSFLFPRLADDPGTGSPGGALLEVASLAEPAGAAFAVPPGLGRPGWRTRDAATMLHRFVNPDAPAGPSPVRVLALKEGKLLKVVARAVGLGLTQSQGAVGIRLTTGSLRNCAVFGASTIRRDQPNRFEAKRAVASTSDCTQLVPTTTSSTTTTLAP